MRRVHAIAEPTIAPRVKSDRLPGLAGCCRPETSAPPSLPICRPDDPDRAQFSNREEVFPGLGGGNDFAGRQSRGTGLRRGVVLRKSQCEKFLRLAVHQNPCGLLIYFEQIGSESVSAINVVDQMCELIVRDRFLVIFEHAPLRFAAENADVVRG